MFTDKYFWLIQPPTSLESFDKVLFYTFAVLTVLAILLLIGKYFIRHPVVEVLVKKSKNLLITIGLIGLVWFGFRYENTPIFAKRVWAGLIIAAGIIWLIFILKYLLVNFGREKAEYDNQLIKSKYIPQRKK